MKPAGSVLFEKSVMAGPVRGRPFFVSRGKIFLAESAENFVSPGGEIICHICDFLIRRKYLYLPSEIMNKGRTIHVLLGSLEFGSQVVETFARRELPCDDMWRNGSV